MVHCSRRGTEAIVGDLSHVFLFEQGKYFFLAKMYLNITKNNPVKESTDLLYHVHFTNNTYSRADQRAQI